MNISDPINEESSAERRLSGGLSALADWPHPVSGVTIEGVVEAGRRGVRRRRRVAALGTAVVVAAAGLGVWGAAAHQPRGATTSTAVVGEQDPADPMVPTAAFGWLPGASTGGFGWTVTPGGDSVIDIENGTVNAALTLQHVGEPELKGPYTPAGTVDGHPAVWVSVGQQELTWQYKPGAWAVLLAEGASDAVTIRIADSLRLGAQSPMAMPFHLPALPAGFTVSGADADRNSQSSPLTGGGTLSLCADSGGCPTKDGTFQDRLSLSASTIVQIKQPPYLKTTKGTILRPGSPGVTFGTPAGHQPTVKIHGVTAQYTKSDGFISVGFDIDGLSVMVQADGTAVKAIGGLDGLVKYLDSITWYGGSPSGWTTNVIG